MWQLKAGRHDHDYMKSKRLEEAKKLIDPKKNYSIEEAVELVKKTSTVKFDASVEIHLWLGIDPKKSEQQVRGVVTLSHGIGKTKRVVAFVEPEKEKEARDAGADIVGGEELINEIATTSKINFDVAISSPAMMPKLAKIAKVIGPKGLMPNPKTDTVGPNIKKMIEDSKGGKVSWKNDDTSNVHQIIGKVSFENQKLIENLQTFVESVRRAKPASAKGIYIQNAVLTSSMGPAIHFVV